MPNFPFQNCSYLSSAYCLIRIIFDRLVVATSDHPLAIIFKRRSISRNTRSRRDVVFGAITPVDNHSSMFVNIRLDNLSKRLRWIGSLTMKGRSSMRRKAVKIGRSSAPRSGSWPCARISQTPGEQMVRCYGHYSSVTREKRQKRVE
jgi:hypothetical protein